MTLQPPPTHGQCVYFEPYRNPDTGRVCPTRDGRCIWAEKHVRGHWPTVWPVAYCERVAGHYLPPTLPNSGPVWLAGEATRCPCFTAKDTRVVYACPQHRLQLITPAQATEMP